MEPVINSEEESFQTLDGFITPIVGLVKVWQAQVVPPSL